jgi:HEAT repeat protein
MTPSKSRFAALGTAALVTLAAVALGGCEDNDPKKPGVWIGKLGGKNAKEVIDAARELRRMRAKEAAQPLVPLLRHEDPLVREEAAYALLELGDPAAVQPLIDAVELASNAKGIGRANSKIAEALGVLGDRKATPTLLKMTETKDAFVKLAAVTALGRLADPAGVPALIRLVENESTEPLVTKRAIIALGELKAVQSLPSLAKALVMERAGVSFFVESSYAMFQIGNPAALALSAIMDGTDKPYLAWAEERRRDPAGYLSKAAVVLGDLGDPAAIPSLVKLMKWEHPAGNDVFRMLVVSKAAEALGRLRAREGAAAITAQLSIEEANIREIFAVALAHIGDPAALPKLEAAAKKGSWTARQAALTGLALLGNGKNRAVFDAATKAEQPADAVKHCLAEEGSPAETDEMKAARCEKERTNRPKFLAEELARLLVADECKADLACWSGKLKDPNVRVRERAAYELGKLKDPAAIPALVTACRDTELPSRRAAYIALDWFARNDAARDALLKARDPLATQLDEEKDRAHTIVVNEDLKRVVWKLRQL